MRAVASRALRCLPLFAVAISWLLGTTWGCASARFDMTLDEFEQGGPVAGGDWSLFVAFKGGPMGGNAWWNVRVDSSGELRAETRRYDADRWQWDVAEAEATIPPAELVRLRDVVDFIANATLPARVRPPHVADVSSVQIACWRGSQLHAVNASGFEYLIEPMSRERSPDPDPEMVRAAADVCFVLAQVLQVWSSPNEWQTTDYYAGWAERAVAVMNEQP